MLGDTKGDAIEEVDPESCKGRIYRGRVNKFVRKNGEYVYQERMSFLKSLSCPGCKYCGFLPDMLNDELYETGSHPIIKDLNDQKLYKLIVTNISTDMETGYCDDYDLEFVEIKPEENADVRGK